MTTSNIKMHVKQDSVYDQKHPQTNSKQVLLNDNSTLDAYLKQGTTFRLVDGMLVFKDPATGTDMTLSTSSLANRSIGNVSNLVLESLLNMANIKWEDPKDTTIATSGESITITTWAGTKVVVKEGSVPRDVNDGTLVVDSKVRNQYKSTGLDISNLVLGKNYYVKLFPYTTEGVFTNDNTNSVHINTNGVPLDTITDITIESVGDTVFARFTDPENKTGVYKGQTYTTAEYAGTKVVMKKGSAPSNHMDGTVVAEYVNRNQHNTNENILKIKTPSEGTWYVTIFNHTTQGVYSQKVNTMTITFLPLDNVTNLSVTAVDLSVAIKWNDPQDKQHFLGTDHTVSTWSGTKLVRKEGSEPIDVNDGLLLLDSKTRDQHSVAAFVDSSVRDNVTYYYKLFPYTDTGKVTNSSDNGKSVTPILMDDETGSPGPSKLIAGDRTEGYYGFVSSSEMITGPALSLLTGVTSGTAINDSVGWLKFNLDGKVLFVSKRPIRNNITWEFLNSKGLVRGKTVEINGSFYKVRLLKGAKQDPFILSSSDLSAKGSEWNRLMLPIHIDAPNDWKINNVKNDNFAGTTKDWGINFTDSDLMLDSSGSTTQLLSWCQEKADSITNGRLLRGGSASISNATNFLQNAAGVGWGWRPVLEYIGPAFIDKYGSPGASKVIARGEKEGYFGQVQNTELIKGTELASKIGLTAGSIIYDTEGWLKFIIDDKIIFVAKKPYRHTVSWDNINATGAVFGSKIINIGGLDYKVRLMQGGENNPSKDTDVDRDAIGSEWNRLMLPIHVNSKTKVWRYPDIAGTNVSNWGIGFTDADLNTDGNASLGSYTWCQEAIISNATNRVVRGAFEVSHAGWYQSNAETGAFAWRPVLELIPPLQIEDNSGSPGATKTIAWNKNEGYFGEVPSTQLITGPSLATKIGLTTGTAMNNDSGWLKYAIDDKIVFVAKKPFRHSISWEQLNLAKAVDGSTTVDIGGLTYKVRLISGISAEGAPASSSVGSEWNRLIMPVHVSASNYGTSFGANFSDVDLQVHHTVANANGVYTWCKEKVNDTTTGYSVRGYNGIAFAFYAALTSTGNNYGWRPVLELVQ